MIADLSIAICSSSLCFIVFLGFSLFFLVLHCFPWVFIIFQSFSWFFTTNLHLSPKCWHDISNTNTYIQLTYIPQIVGSTYPMQIYIFKNVHSLTLWFFIIFHRAWHDISDINIYIQLTYTPQKVGSIYPIQIYIS